MHGYWVRQRKILIVRICAYCHIYLTRKVKALHILYRAPVDAYRESVLARLPRTKGQGSKKTREPKPQELLAAEAEHPPEVGAPEAARVTVAGVEPEAAAIVLNVEEDGVAARVGNRLHCN